MTSMNLNNKNQETKTINPFNGIDEYTRHHTHDVIWFKFEKKLHGKGVNKKIKFF